MNRIGGGYTTSMYWFKLIEIHSKQLSCSGTYTQEIYATRLCYEIILLLVNIQLAMMMQYYVI